MLLGAVVRDDLGMPVLMFQMPLPGCVKVDSGEDMAVLLGFKCAVSLGFTPIKIELDNKHVMELINNPSQGLSDAGIFINKLVGQNGGVSCRHIARLANGVAHSLARKALMLSSTEVRVSDFLGFYLRLLQIICFSFLFVWLVLVLLWLNASVKKYLPQLNLIYC